jgi:hypothetical protein
MCLSPKSSRSNINSFFNTKNNFKDISKKESNQCSKKKLSSRNNEILKVQKKNIYKKILTNNLAQFSSNNSTSTNTSNFNNVKTHNRINYDFDSNSNMNNPDYIKRNNKFVKKQEHSNILVSNTREKIDNFLQKCKNKNKTTMSNSSTNIMKGHNRSLSKNLNQEFVISKIVDKLAFGNINKMNKYNLELNNKNYKNEFEKTFLGSMTTKDNNPYTTKNKIDFLISPSYKNIISINNINSPGLSRHSALASSTKNIYSKKTKNQTNSNKQNRPNSNDNMKRLSIQRKSNSKCNQSNMNLSKSKEINNNNFNNLTKKQKNLNNGVGLNNNKIEYVQINLFNGGNDEKITKEGKNLIFNKFEKRRNQPRKKINKSKDKEVKLFDNDINCSNDGLYLTNTYLSYNDKSKRYKEITTPEENHFQAIAYIQLIKNNDKKFS